MSVTRENAVRPISNANDEIPLVVNIVQLLITVGTYEIERIAYLFCCYTPFSFLFFLELQPIKLHDVNLGSCTPRRIPSSVENYKQHEYWWNPE